MEVYEFFILTGVGFATGFINTVAGGGSLITLPVLMSLGLSHTEANGTNRLGILVQSVSALAGFKSKSVSSFPTGMHQGFIAVIGSFGGAMLALVIEARTFDIVLSIIMMIVLVLILLDLKPSSNQINTNTNLRYYMSLIGFFFVGVYGGFIQAGLGFLSIAISRFVNGFDIHRANHVKVFVTFCITLMAFAIFLWEGKVLWRYGITLAVSSAFGAWVSSRWSIEKGEGAVKMFLVICFALFAFKLLLPNMFNNLLNKLVSPFL